MTFSKSLVSKKIKNKEIVSVAAKLFKLFSDFEKEYLVLNKLCSCFERLSSRFEKPFWF